MNEITEEQRSIIAAMCAHIKIYGVPPTLGEIVQTLGGPNKTTIRNRILRLVSLGVVVQWPDMDRGYIPATVFEAARNAARELENTY